MLDDLSYIHHKDTEDALGIVGRQGSQLLHQFRFTQPLQAGPIGDIVYAGMGGSALAALLVHTWPPLPKPFELVRNYDIPAYVGSQTLFIASSYSGNTEETLSALQQAAMRSAQVVVIASGGELSAVAREKGYPLLLVPEVDQPRYAVLYNFRALLHVLEEVGLVERQAVIAELEQTAQWLNRSIAAWQPDVSTKMNPAKQLALELIGKSIVLYAGPKLYPTAYKWKISFNENAKQIAWVNQLPEFNHNEFIGWSKQPVSKPYAVVDLRSSLEHPRVQKRFVVTERLLSGMRPAPHVVNTQGETILNQLLWTTAYGDFVSIYVALLNGLNPAPVELVEKFKRELNK